MEVFMKRVVLFSIGVCFVALFEIDLEAAVTLTTLHVFHDTDGHGPTAALVLGTNGHFYGTTPYGGTSTACIDGCGTVFEISASGAFTSLHSFTNFDGSAPRTELVQASDGNLYGTTSSGGMFGSGSLGTVFKMTPAGVVTMLHSFLLNEGFDPDAGLVEDGDGVFYGTTSSGGRNGAGTVYRITSEGAYTEMAGVTAPAAGVIKAKDGHWYGTTQAGGISANCPSGCGSVFKMTPGGVVSTIHSFNGSDGKEPIAELVEGADGKLYGTTSGGLASLNCAAGCGTVFQITTNGDFTTLFAFSGANGRQPRAGLIQASDGNLYGTTFYGGQFGVGTVFQVTTNGTHTRLLSFSALIGANPAAGLIEDSQFNLYGTTQTGGAMNGQGTVFKMTLPPSYKNVLTPTTATESLGAVHTVIATVTSNGIALAGAVVNFNVTAGPNAGQTGSATTDASGHASFSYTGGPTTGTDTIQAAVLGTTATATVVWVAPDSVGDGIPDWWRAQYFGGDGTTTNGQSCAGCDADGTGQNNLFKYTAGLDPTNPASVFVTSVQSVTGQPGQMQLIYSPVADGRIYAPQFRTDMANGTWEALTGFGGPVTNNNRITITDRSATQKFKAYRIGISLP